MLMPGQVGELRKKGFDVIAEPDHDWPDALIVFSAEPSPDDWDTLRALMSARQPIENPTYRGR